MLATLQYAKDNGMQMPSKVIALSPWADLMPTYPSTTYNQKDSVLSANEESSDEMKVMFSQLENPFYATAEERATNKFVSPILGDYAEFPETLIIAGQHESLVSTATILLEKITASGSDASLYIEKMMPHDYAF